MTVDKIRWPLAKAYPVIGTIPIAQTTPHEALAVLRKVEAAAQLRGGTTRTLITHIHPLAVADRQRDVRPTLRLMANCGTIRTFRHGKPDIPHCQNPTCEGSVFLRCLG